MEYTEVTFRLTPCSETATDVLAALAGDIGFESFVPTPDGVQGYVPTAQYDEEALRLVLATFPMDGVGVTFEAQPMEDKDWNAEWERNYFQPIVVAGGRAVVHSTFHTDYPKADYDIVINPQMAFGTGHHQTTRLVMSYILDADFVDKDVLDMGCGTGILAILACMRGARHADAIDIDPWCVDNTRDNIALQHDDSPACGLVDPPACGLVDSLTSKLVDSLTRRLVDQITVLCGDASLLADRGPYDIILANINRNILLADMPCYVARLRPGGHLFISGFYLADLPLLREKAESLGLRYLSHRTDSDWTAAEFVL